MDKKILRPVSVACAKLEMAEDEDYNTHLCRFLDTPEVQVMNLYRVSFHTLKDGKWTQPLFVLAESEDGAADQATAHPWAIHIESLKKEEDYVVAVCRVPLLIRGWGKTEF